MFTQESLMEYISDYILECDALGIHFSRVILFGSYAKKNPHEWSDIDLALVSDSYSGFTPDDRV